MSRELKVRWHQWRIVLPEVTAAMIKNDDKAIGVPPYSLTLTFTGKETVLGLITTLN